MKKKMHMHGHMWGEYKELLWTLHDTNGWFSVPVVRKIHIAKCGKSIAVFVLQNGERINDMAKGCSSEVAMDKLSFLLDSSRCKTCERILNRDETNAHD